MEFVSSCLTELFESSREGVALIDEAGTLLWHNAALEELVTFPEESFLQAVNSWQWSVESFVPVDPKDFPAPGETGQAICISPDGAGQEGRSLVCFSHRLASGPLSGWLLLRFVDFGPVQEAETRERVRRESERLHLQEMAMRSAHLASMGELAAGVAHEINNPITGIINCGQLLYDQMASGSTDQAIALRIIREGERISAIVRSLLSLARHNPEKKTGVRIEEELMDVFSLTRAQMRKERIIKILRIAPELPLITANPQQLRQVFLNIINNARYALNEKYPGFSDEKVIEIRGEKIAEPAGVRLTFLDHGTGIPEAVQERIFHPFFTTKPVGRGTGLGLSISHAIIAEHHGEIRVESSEGEFTRVIVELPAGGEEA